MDEERDAVIFLDVWHERHKVSQRQQGKTLDRREYLMTSHLGSLELFLAAGLHSLTWLDPELFLYWWVPFRSRPESVRGCRRSRERPSYTLPNPWIYTVKDTPSVLLQNTDFCDVG